jgi:acetyl/propionyl-CoA carboxylase alpha subunit
VFQDSVVPLDYDPMVAKLVVTAPDRPAAVARLKRALWEYRIGGIATTLTLFRALVGMEEFAEGDFHTGFLDELLASQRLAELHGEPVQSVEEAAVVAAACLATMDAGGLGGAPFPHAEESHWWREGVRQLHGRYPR